MFRLLDSREIIRSIERLERRIGERFPESNLRRVCREVLGVANDAKARVERIRRPILWVRALETLLIALVLGAVISVPLTVRLSPQVEGIAELVQAVESGINDVVFIGIALVFVATWEGRLKRRRSLSAVHELRVLAHIVDMHQLTKDPAVLLTPGPSTESSPARTMTPFELSRYLDYCSELLSHIAKVAALYAQHLADPVVLEAVNDVESLTDGFSRKIWQKMTMVGRLVDETPTPSSLT
jgi:hypothetical protein